MLLTKTALMSAATTIALIAVLMRVPTVKKFVLAD